MSGFYEDLCNLFIRPVRQTYNDYDLGSTLIGKTGNRQNFTFKSGKGLQLKGSFFKHKHTDINTCVIYLHSFNGSRLQSLRYVPDILARGFHFCSFDFAGCGNSPGQYVSLGYNQRWDVLKLVEYISNRYNLNQFFIWGRSMGAVTAIKFYSLLSQQQISGKYPNCKILGIILDSAFISLKRLVVEVGRSRVSIPQILIKAIFLMIESSIQQRADFKVEELQLQKDVETIRCSTMLITSKQDTFINFNHSQDIFNHLKIHENKQIQYIRGEHYQNRDHKIINTIYDFIQKKYKQNLELQIRAAVLRQSQIKQTLTGKINRNHQASLQRISTCLRKYEPRAEAMTDRKNQANHLRIHNGLHKKVQTSTKILLFRPNPSDKSSNNPISEDKTVESDKKISFQNNHNSNSYKHYQTQKKIEINNDPQIKIVISSASKQFKQNNQIHNKNKPSFVGRTFQLSANKTIQDNININQFDKRFQSSNQNTQECSSRRYNQQNHRNIISDKLKKKAKPHRPKITSEETEQNMHKININHHAKKATNSVKITFNSITIDDVSTKEENQTKNAEKNDSINHIPSYKKLSMTAQQYKNNQMTIIKQFMGSNSDRRRLNINAFAEIKMKQGRETKQSTKKYEQSKSMNNLNIHPVSSEVKQIKSIAKMNSYFNTLSLSQRNNK